MRRRSAARESRLPQAASWSAPIIRWSSIQSSSRLAFPIRCRLRATNRYAGDSLRSAATDTAVLWWGAVWQWLDAETPIRAFATLARSRPDLKLSQRPPERRPTQTTSGLRPYREARDLARQLGVLDRNVLFLDEWIPYEQRWDYLHEADLGLTLHRNAEEAELAVRSRYVDYLSAALPCVLGRGDQTAAEFEAAGFATLVDHPSPGQPGPNSRVVDRRPDEARGRSFEAGRRLAAGCNVHAAAETLRAAVALARSKQAGRPTARGLALAEAAGFYYARKLADRLFA